MVKPDRQNQKYKQEIEEGTRKRQLLLTEGRNRGMSEDEVLSTFGQFLPSVQTPIMNFLFFLMREEDEQSKLKKMTEQFISEFVREYPRTEFYLIDNLQELLQLINERCPVTPHADN